MGNEIRRMAGYCLLELASALEAGSGKAPRIVVSGTDSEHGEENVLKAALAASRGGIEICYIGSLESEGIQTIKAAGAEAHNIMEGLLGSGEADAAVTMHYPFPIGVATVGRVITPARGKEIFIATTTGASSADRVEGMTKNAIYGIIAAKSCGVKNPSVGVLNIDGATRAEAALRELRDNGYELNLCVSARAGGGAIMRGNDILLGTPDVLVCDPLTGNILVKMLSAGYSGGGYEVFGYGYGPGIGEGYGRLVLIVSRASGAPVIQGAIEYAAELVRGRIRDVAGAEFDAAERAGLKRILGGCGRGAEKSDDKMKPPAPEPVTESIGGIEVMDIEDAVRALWKNGIYAESGMGCTGPIVMMSRRVYDRALEILRAEGYIQS